VFLLRKGETRPGLIEALLAAQERCGRPIQIVPVVVLWRRAPDRERWEVGRALVGSEDAPGPLHKLVAVLTRPRQDSVLVQAGEAVELEQVAARYAEAPQADVVRRLAILLRRYLYRESRVVRGPRSQPHRWSRRRVLHSTEVREQIAAQAEAQGRTVERVEREALKTYDHIAARFSYPAVRLSRAILNPLYNRIFSGIDVRPADLERLRAALRDGTPILAPCHRSHLDYLLISSVCFENNIVLPHIVARESLSFFPLGPLLRRLGALFVRRSGSSDPLFNTVFRRYLQKLIGDGFPVEFFIEGGRSRSGKLRPPRLGLLSIILDAAAENRDDRAVTFLPVCITYEQIAEEKAYARELAGSTKPTESLREIVRAGRRLRGSRMGRVYIRVGEPLPASEVLEARPGGWAAARPEHQRELLEQTGERLMYRIARETVMTPSAVMAMALLSGHAGRRLAPLRAHAHRLEALLRRCGAQPAASMAYGDKALEEALSRFEASRLIELLSDDVDEVIQISDSRRVTLDYYKNNLLHFVAPISLLAAAVRSNNRAFAGDDAEIFRLFRTQVFLLRYECPLDPEQPLEELEQATLAALLEYGALSAEDGGFALADAERLEELAVLTDNLRESYSLTLKACHALRSQDITARELPKKVLAHGRAGLAIGELRMPESLSIVNLEVAIRAFREEGVLQLRADGGLQFEPDGLAQYLQDLGHLLSRPAAAGSG
jgi:glycerol-3-phosphate O-acyltransferase